MFYEMNFDLSDYYKQIIFSVLTILLGTLVKFIAQKIVNSFSHISHKADKRKNMIIKYIDILIYIIFGTIILLIWGVDTGRVMTSLTSILAFIGVALFAQWSILSNITAGIIMFFSFPYKIGDRIKIQDKDFPTEAEIIDIKAFHTILVTEEGEKISFPNNLFLQKSIVILEEV